MAIIGERWGLFPKLKEWVAEKKPIWGTCAGMILLSDYAIKQAKCGQTLVGGLDAHVCRNFFGSQIHSCQVEITIDPTSSGIISVPGSDNSNKCPAVFIRAPAILSIGPDVEILARIVAAPHSSARSDVMKLLEEAKGKLNSISAIMTTISELSIEGNDQPRSKRQRLSKSIPASNTVTGVNESTFEVFVAVRQGNILATAFHPELTEDTRWHRCVYIF